MKSALWLKSIFKKEAWKLDNREHIKHKLPHLFYLIIFGVMIYIGYTVHLSSLIAQGIIEVLPTLGYIASALTIVYIIFPTTDTK